MPRWTGLLMASLAVLASAQAQNQTCEGGCTYTRGWWSTHYTGAGGEGASRNIPWPDVDGNPATDTEDQTVCQIIDSCYGIQCSNACTLDALSTHKTPPKGEKWIILVRQWIASVLNTKKVGYDDEGAACTTAEIDSVLAAAAALLASGCDGDATGTLSGADAANATALSEFLDLFNNGDVGPGHCDAEFECPDPENERCGCTYTQGYWGSPRFTSAEFEEQFASDRSVHGTCHWPAEGELDDRHHDTLGCEGSDSDWFEIMTESAVRNGPDSWLVDANRQWWTAARQYIAAHLNFQNGACPDDCEHPVQQVLEDCSAMHTLLSDDEIAALFIDNNYECVQRRPFKLKCEDLTTAVAECQALCDSLELEEDDCTLNDVLSGFNEGLAGPGHCNNHDGENERGCCEHCSYLEVRPAHISLAGDDAVELDNGVDLELMPGWWDIANFVLLVLIFLILIGFVIWKCTQRGNKPMYSETSKSTLADTQHWN